LNLFIYLFRGLLAGRISPLLPHQPTLDIGCSRLRAGVIEISKFEAQNHPCKIFLLIKKLILFKKALNGVKKVTYCNPKLSIEELSPQSRRIASWPCNVSEIES
jgi:hypothetical protein